VDGGYGRPETQVTCVKSDSIDAVLSVQTSTHASGSELAASGPRDFLRKQRHPAMPCFPARPSSLSSVDLFCLCSGSSPFMKGGEEDWTHSKGTPSNTLA